MESDPYLQSFQILSSGIVLLIGLDETINFITLILLLLCSGLFSGSEIAMFSLTHDDLDDIREHDNPASGALLKLKDHPKRLLALILVCNTFVNIGIALIVARLLAVWLPYERYASWGQIISDQMGFFNYTPEKIGTMIYFLIAVFGATILILFFGEIMPKIYGRLNTKRFALFMALPLRFFDYIFYPMTSLMVSMTNKVEKKLLEKKVGLQSTSKEDLDAAIDLAISNDTESERQVDILKGIIKFNDVSTKQVMTPRTQVYGIDFDEKYHEVIKIVKESGFSRLPVYNDDFDQITGILYAKDLIGHLHKGNDFEWQTLIRTNVLYVPESRKINEILNDFREQHVHMAFVVDEYGGTNGIVTLEDIMEEIVGEIKDEFDEQHELNYIKLDPNTYLFDGKTLINDMCRVLGVDISKFEEARGNADSIAGLILEHSGDMPKKDQELIIEGYKFLVTSVSKRRIEQIKITI